MSKDNAAPAQSDTPRTDAEVRRFYGERAHEDRLIPSAFARQLERELSALRAKQSSKSVDGMVLVPRELTPDMAEAASKATNIDDAWRDMLAAAPAQSGAPIDSGAWGGNADGLTELLKENKRLNELAERQMNDAEAARLELAELRAKQSGEARAVAEKCAELIMFQSCGCPAIIAKYAATLQPATTTKEKP